jgi:Imidazolonepropionase-like composite domain, bacteria
MQRPLVVHGVTIVIGDETGTLLCDGALAVADDRIAALGRAADVLARHATAERIEIQGQAGRARGAHGVGSVVRRATGVAPAARLCR